MNPMNDSTNKLIETLKKQIKIRDDKINAITRKNEVQSIVIESFKKKYRTIILIYTILLMISSGIAIYNLIFK